ncbi:MAG: hypothetical protein AABX34_03570 [Nanoarchaeota archaeon]
MELQQLDSYSWRQVYAAPYAWNHIRYSVNARLEFELAHLAQQLPREEFFGRFKLRPAFDQSIITDWTQFAGVYIPACFLEFRANPEKYLQPEQIEFFQRVWPKEYADGTVFSGLFARDDLNYFPIIDSGGIAQNRTLAEIVLGGAGGISSEEKIRKLLEDGEWRLRAAEFARTLLENTSKEFNGQKGDYNAETALRDLTGMLIAHYQKEIENPQTHVQLS